MYRALQSFKMGNQNIKAGQKVYCTKQQAKELLSGKPLIYKTKEDKRAYEINSKATIEHDGGPMFLVKKGKQIVDRLKKSEAEELRDKINAES